jgi:hypothetical protein
MIKELKANAMKISLQYSPAELIKRLIWYRGWNLLIFLIFAELKSTRRNV